jgi:osmotically-inducible protein OsmY
MGRIVFICWLMMGLVSFGASSTGAGKAAATASLSDAQIERDLKARLGRSKLASNHFQVRVQGGVAIIDGKTEVIQHKGIATRMARAAGARSVTNRIEVSEAAKARATARLDAGRARRAQVQRVAKP